MKLPLLIVLTAIVAITLSGAEGMGRLALRVGWSDAAAYLLPDPAARGVALFRIGDYAGADRAFAEAGRSQTYNRGLSLAATGNYPLSVAYFDAMLFANPADAQARANRDLVATMFAPVRGESTTHGRLAGAGGIQSDEAVDSKLLANASGPKWDRQLERRGLAATDEWLETISDDPGEFLRLRIRAEYIRRASLGLIRPKEAEPW